MLKFIHTADWQIGKVFRFADGSTMGLLQEARLAAITRLGELAVEHDNSHVDETKLRCASLKAGDTGPLKAGSKFGAKPYTEDDKKELSEILKAFNEGHGTEFSEADMIRFEQVNREIMDEDMIEMPRNNPPDIVYSAFSQAFFQGAIRVFQRYSDMKVSRSLIWNFRSFEDLDTGGVAIVEGTAG